MPKFGLFELGKSDPTEIYEGDYLALETGFARIFEGDASFTDATKKPRLVAAIHLDKSQSVREIKVEVKHPSPEQKSTKAPAFVQSYGRKFR